MRILSLASLLCLACSSKSSTTQESHREAPEKTEEKVRDLEVPRSIDMPSVEGPSVGSESKSWSAPPLIVAINEEGALSLEGMELSADELSVAIQERVRGNEGEKELQVVLHADESVPHGEVVKVMDNVIAAGISKVAIATSVKEKK